MSAPAPSFDAPLLLGAQIEARATHPDVAGRIFLRQNDRTWTYRQLPRRVRCAWRTFSAAGSARSTIGGPRTWPCCSRIISSCSPSTAAAAYAGVTLFGVNTGLRGDTLAGVVNQSRARLLVVDQRLLAGGRARARRAWRTWRPRTCWSYAPRASAFDATDLDAALRDEVGAPDASLDAHRRST